MVAVQRGLFRLCVADLDEELDEQRVDAVGLWCFVRPLLGDVQLPSWNGHQHAWHVRRGLILRGRCGPSALLR